MAAVRTRFAPSPTGYMHIGGMRTALFNWLWARHHGGAFILRIDDTDRQRNVDAALAPILRAFRWLGLDWDEGPEVEGPFGPYFQSQRGPLYAQAVAGLLASGHAYRCFETPEQIQADRQEAEREKRNYLNVRRSLEMSESQVQQAVESGSPHVIRLLVPRDEKIVIDDAVRGRVEWDAGLIADPVICRADGSPLYNFATVVDDAHMQITHVIRAEEHLSNTPIQVLLYGAMGHALPSFAHIPFITAPGTNKKLSKREIGKYRNNPGFRKLFEKGDAVFPLLGLSGGELLNPVMVEYYERVGYLPEAVLNALARLGWSLDDSTEIMSLETVVQNFTLDRVVKSPAGFDADKLISFQTHWVAQLDVSEKVSRCLPYLQQAGWVIAATESDRTRIAEVVTLLGDRLKVFSDILEYPEFFLADDALPYNQKDVDKRLRREGVAELLRQYRDVLSGAESFTAQELEAGMKTFVESAGIKLGDIIHAVRVAVTGRGTGAGMFETLQLLGKERCLARIDRALTQLT